MSEERVMIFIDGSNFYHGLKYNVSTTKIDFYKFSKILCGDRKLIRTYYYNVPVKQESKEYKAQQRFFSQLDNTPISNKSFGKIRKKRGYFC